MPYYHFFCINRNRHLVYYESRNLANDLAAKAHCDALSEQSIYTYYLQAQNAPAPNDGVYRFYTVFDQDKYSLDYYATLALDADNLARTRAKEFEAVDHQGREYYFI